MENEFNLDPLFDRSPRARAKRMIGRLLNTRFLLIAILLHALVLIIFGGNVLFEKYAKVNLESSNLIAPSAAPAYTPPPSGGREQKFDVSIKPVEMAKQETRLATEKLASSFNVQIPDVLTPHAAVPTDMAASLTGSGSGRGMGQGAGNFLSMSTLFGNGDVSSDGIVGTLYDFKQTPDRRETSIKTPAEFDDAIRDFLAGWSLSRLTRYYKSRTQLLTYQFFIPEISADEAPNAFGVANEVKPSRWAVIYKGKFTPVRDMKCRFVGLGDDWLILRINNRIVLDAGMRHTDDPPSDIRAIVPNSEFGKNKDLQKLYSGKWISFKAGQVYSLDMLIAESPGGFFSSLLLYQEEGKLYKPRKDAPKALAYSVFQVRPTSLPEFEIGKQAPDVALPQDEAQVFSLVADSKLPTAKY